MYHSGGGHSYIFVLFFFLLHMPAGFLPTLWVKGRAAGLDSPAGGGDRIMFGSVAWVLARPVLARRVSSTFVSPLLLQASGVKGIDWL